ncbi:MAG: GNAT family N-acetyltransferase [Euzebyaceae bacterium]|jgi:predicted N-acetyltransferase YhbS|nr:GNAT family N-acetyltransferase [Euzebyaceae bacterium]
MNVRIRPMTTDDVAGVDEQKMATFEAQDREEGREPELVPDDVHERNAARLHHQLGTDPDGCLVAVEGGRIVGHVVALLREYLWCLPMLHVHPESQSGGIGRRLLDAALDYGKDAEAGIIMASSDPRALRLYTTSGFVLHPAMEISGRVRHRPPAPVGVREGGDDDFGLTVEVDRRVRGVPHGANGNDVRFIRDLGSRFAVLDRGGERGYVLWREGRVVLLAATTEAVACELLRHVLAAVGDDDIDIWAVTGSQQWAIRTAYDAGLVLKPGGALLTRGRLGPMTPYLASGLYL